jgi:pimeloyl-ACP methyl ester carboxylesterase
MVNPRGAGNSSPTLSTDDLSMRRLADDLERLRQQLGHARWVFARFSAGGYVGLLYAVKYHTSLQGLILAATAPSGQFRYDPECIYNPERADWAQIQAARDRALVANATPDDVRRWGQIVYHNPEVIARHVRAAEQRAERWSDSVSNLNPTRMAAMRAELGGDRWLRALRRYAAAPATRRAAAVEDRNIRHPRSSVNVAVAQAGATDEAFAAVVAI